ncbi:MBL fold metallo-hydrolase [Butyrivibrio sp. MC2013]|uniref:MBL fold metallo-hydrolase n=1 Tax=Butyrivibrio sp. MC2013 TaxID=1280686 RepID=UPI0004269088|nr:MBL fold metallo-hydrolase [Butyrivibrio sp. MC2013]
MKIINLIENTEGAAGCSAAHGLSFYIETPMHRLLMDLGPSSATLDNAVALGIDLSNVDTVILSHGHYDHSGGIMPFAEVNDRAVIYMQRSALGEYYSVHVEETQDSKTNDHNYTDEHLSASCRYIGIDKSIAELKGLRLLDGDYRIDDELSVFVIDERVEDIPFTNARLKVKRGDIYEQDDFSHEEALVISAEGKNILLSGCAHNGMINILEVYRRKYGGDPDIAISGFHLVKKSEYTGSELSEIRNIAERLMKYNTKFYTCHCTGLIAFDIMREIMGDKLDYIHTGGRIF